MEPYAWRRIYTFRIRQPTSQHPVGSSLVIPKSPHIYRVIFLAVIKVFGTHQYSRPLICLTPFLMYQGTTICLVVKQVS